LIPLELEKLKTKIKSEIRAAEVRIGYLLKKSTRPKPTELTEIQERH
jgi:hypothetical protein